MLNRLFSPVNGYTWYAAVGGCLLASAFGLALLQLLPPRGRRYLIFAVTFLAGLFFAVEFFWPVHTMRLPGNPRAQGNFLTPFIVPFGTISPVIQGFAVGLGVVNLTQIHGGRLLKRSPGSINSLAFFVSMIAMTVVNILQQAHPNAINKNLNLLLYNGGLQSLDATVFSIIAFYIVSASYRAFRIRSLEASVLLGTAILVMLGQIGLGQWLTGWVPQNGPWASFHTEAVRMWILTQPNAAATRAIQFGIGIGTLAMALRVWLGLERGAYFEGQ